MSPHGSGRVTVLCPSSQAAPKVMRPTFKRVQVVYYLSRNGQLEHPHYIEVTHLTNQHLRLKDVIERLIVLRGKAMPSMYSWSCKRSYKNGYVWNDLAENDIIYPSEGAEYILKGSEVVEGCTDKVQELQLGNTQRHLHHQQYQQIHKPKHIGINQYDDDDDMDKNVDIDEENKDIEYEKKVNYTNSVSNPHRRRCSRGVSTDELEPKPNNSLTEFPVNDSSPPSTTSSTVSDKATEGSNVISKRFEDGDPVGTEPLLSKSSMLFQLIACGGSLSFRKTVPVEKQQPQQPLIATAAASSAIGRKSNCNELHKGVLCKSLGANVSMEDEVDDEIRCMSENPRFGNMQSEEKEYFSGSIVDAMGTEERAHVEPCLKKSSSYNEERCSKTAFAEAAEEEEETIRENTLKSKCMPRKKSSTSTTKQLKK